MISNEEYFSASMAGSVLTTAEEDIQVEVLVDLLEKADRSSSTLEAQIYEAKKAGKQAGDFGMEIIGPLVLPVLIEAGKALWKLYIKKLGEKAAGELADMTVAGAKKLAKSVLSGEEKLISMKEYEAELRKAAAQEGIPDLQVEKLVIAIKKHSNI